MLRESKVAGLTAAIRSTVRDYSDSEYIHYYIKWEGNDHDRYWEMSTDFELPREVRYMAYDLMKLTRPMQLVSFNQWKPEGQTSTATLKLVS